jgi:hypothetical protein
MDIETVEQFDRAFRGLRNAQRKVARGEGGLSTAITEGQHRAVCERLAPQVDEARRERLSKALA